MASIVVVDAVVGLMIIIYSSFSVFSSHRRCRQLFFVFIWWLCMLLAHCLDINSGWQRVYRVTSAIDNNVHRCVVHGARDETTSIYYFRERKLCWLKGRCDAWMHDRHQFGMDETDGWNEREKNGWNDLLYENELVSCVSRMLWANASQI